MNKNNKFRILVINPGSTSTKVSVFENEKELFKNTISHGKLELEPFKKVWDQYEFRKKLIKDLLEENNIDPKSYPQWWEGVDFFARWSQELIE